MKNSVAKIFPAKILLYGEYSIIINSWALAIPYPLFGGQLVFPHSGSSIDPELKSFAQSLQNIKNRNELDQVIDVDSFAFDVLQGLIFQSNIPQGYGLGSSGALCAAVYERYKRLNNPELDPESVAGLKILLAGMESHFHGASSGIDPLISYLGRALLIKNRNDMSQIQLPDNLRTKGGLFLLNTARPRRTEPLVNLFLEKIKSIQFEDLCRDKLIPITNSCIESFLSGDEENHYRSFYQLSSFQFEHFAPMIPKLYQQFWQKGLESDDYALKLCGAGGGGYILGVTRDYSLARQKLGGQEIRPVYPSN